MVTARIIYQRKINELKLKRKELKKELKDLDIKFEQLVSEMAKYEELYKALLKLDIYSITENTKLRHTSNYKKGFREKTIRLKTMAKAAIALKKRKVEAGKELELADIIVKDLYFLTFVAKIGFDEFVNQMLRGIPYMSLGRGLKFKAMYNTVDNSDGVKRLNKHKTKLNKDRILARGGKVQHLRFGQEGEHFIEFHDNVVDLSYIHFSKVTCRERNIKWYKFIPTRFALRSGKKIDDYNFTDIEQLFCNEFSTNFKLRMIDRHFPEHRDFKFDKRMTYDN